MDAQSVIANLSGMSVGVALLAFSPSPALLAVYAAILVPLALHSTLNSLGALQVCVCAWRLVMPSLHLKRSTLMLSLVCWCVSRPCVCLLLLTCLSPALFFLSSICVAKPDCDTESRAVANAGAHGIDAAPPLYRCHCCISSHPFRSRRTNGFVLADTDAVPSHAALVWRVVFSF